MEIKDNLTYIYIYDIRYKKSALIGHVSGTAKTKTNLKTY